MSSKAKATSFFGILTSNCQSKMELHIGNTFISNARLKMARNQGKVKQHPDAERFLFENVLLSLSTLSSKNNRRYSKNVIKTSTYF